MSAFLKLGEESRRNLIVEAANRLAVLPVITEKDFWVCWMLGRIFQDAEWARHIVFKGGTSLSKVFGVINRFSEDIDLSVSPRFLGVEESTLESAPSKGKRQKLFDGLQDECAQFVSGRFQPKLESIVRGALGARASGKNWLVYKIDERTDSPVLLFEYPSSLKLERGYIDVAVKLEFGSLTDQQPTGKHTVTPMLADAMKDFKDESEEVVALEVERSFWEKATILHAEYHRPADKPPAIGISRHYYDMYCLSRNPAGERALADIDLLTRVRKHKQSFFRSAWAHYDTAMPGSFHLAPAPDRRQQIERDYRDMTDMFMSTPPPFAAMMTHLAAVEEKFNAGKIGQMRTDLDRPR